MQYGSQPAFVGLSALCCRIRATQIPYTAISDPSPRFYTAIRSIMQHPLSPNETDRRECVRNMNKLVSSSRVEPVLPPAPTSIICFRSAPVPFLRGRTRARARVRRARFAFLAQLRIAGTQDLPHPELRRMGPQTHGCTIHIGTAPEPVGKFRLRSEWPFPPQAPEPPSPWPMRALSET